MTIIFQKVNDYDLFTECFLRPALAPRFVRNADLPFCDFRGEKGGGA